MQQQLSLYVLSPDAASLAPPCSCSSSPSCVQQQQLWLSLLVAAAPPLVVFVSCSSTPSSHQQRHLPLSFGAAYVSAVVLAFVVFTSAPIFSVQGSACLIQLVSMPPAVCFPSTLAPALLPSFCSLSKCLCGQLSLLASAAAALVLCLAFSCSSFRSCVRQQ